MQDFVQIKVFAQSNGDVIFEGKVSTDVSPVELVYLGCFVELNLGRISYKATNDRVTSFKTMAGTQNIELFASYGEFTGFSGVLYIAAEDLVLRKSDSVPSCKCLLMSLWDLSAEKCDGVFECKTSKELEINRCQIGQIPNEIGKLKKLKRLKLVGLVELKTLPEQIGELSSLENLRVEWCGLESFPKRLNELKLLKSIHLMGLPELQLCQEDASVIPQLKQLAIMSCEKAFSPQFAQSFWEKIKATVELHTLDLDWHLHALNPQMVAALAQNGSIVGSNWYHKYEENFMRNRENHWRAMACVLQLLAIRRWRGVLNGVPKELVSIIAIMLWNTRCNIGAWRKRHTKACIIA